MKKQDVDYTLYLVTDSRPEILRGRNICDVVEAALKGGVTCVQFRDKTSDTGELIRIARELHGITRRYNVPLLINDRVDVALAVGCEGCHVGQDDIKLEDARRLLGPDAIIGVSASTLEQAVEAYKGGADYLGIGAVYATPTKTNTKNILGPEGVRRVLKGLAGLRYSIPSVCIGGINTTNAQSVITESGGANFWLNGIAVVSVIMGADDPEQVANGLLELLGPVLPSKHATGAMKTLSTESDLRISNAIKAVHDTTPLSHNMTNLVVQNFAANVALAVGASPIMSNNGEEAADLAKLGGALVLNMGTVTPDSMRNYLAALEAYNGAERPVVFDPVGAGATSVRRSALKTILDHGYITVIKGNEGEITTVYNETSKSETTSQSVQQRGVDSTSVLSEEEKIRVVAGLATRFQNVVVMTGKTDYVSDGKSTYAIGNGHEYLGMVTGTGCVLGTTISAMVAANTKGDTVHTVIAGLLLFEIAAEVAAERPDVQGPGTFVPAFIDELARLRKLAAKGDSGWLERAEIRDLSKHE
ncbi:TMP-TENI-domain-containing protein [Coniochaeta ligniaria NRRL 30616]|uniref:TMP-TENI-domain-containing protein n=1 Tax=Coniochaeta ligniaria NRRL 30616 TaxID=1408157 RepID=A0A1J7K1T3_9PEZI|nr:TMP-TENI-domain-containing protein [Coniochaeta ligniaria NRRL 30616]